MAATLNITDGTTTVNLLSAKVDYQLRADGYSQSDPEIRQVRRESQFAEGEALISSNPQNVIETFTISIYGTSHDAIATNLQKLVTLQREAKESQTTNWQTTPVYLTEKTVDETNTRYARVIQIRIQNLSPLFSSIFNTQNAIGKITILVEREPYFRSAAPQSLPSALSLGAPQAPAGQVDATRQVIANFRDTIALTHIYNEDNSGGPSYSANLIASTVFDYFPAVPALNDAVYFGSTSGPFRIAVMYLSIALSAGVNFTWEFWNGAIWTTGIYPSYGADAVWTSTGTRLISVDTPTGWTTNAVNGVTAYWIRCRISNFVNWTTSPRQGAQVVYNARDTYFSIANDQINGDVDALALLRLLKQHTNTISIKFVALGLKSRGLTAFTSRLNAGGQNPTGWSEAYGTDTTQVADINAPGNNRASCTFATATTMTTRVTITNTTGSITKDFGGVYQAYLRCQQSGGSAGAVSVRLVVTSDAAVNGDTIALTGVAAGIELINLGRITISAVGFIEAVDTGRTLTFAIQASATSVTPDIYIYDLILIPVDEWSTAIGPASTNGMSDQAMLDLDNGLIRTGAILKSNVNSGLTSVAPSGLMEQRGMLPLLPPDKAFRIYAVFGGYSSGTTPPLLSQPYFGVAILVYVHQRWVFMRGSE